MLIVGVLGSRHGKLKCGQVARLKAGIDLQESIQALTHKSSANEKDNGCGQFDDYQIRSELVPHGS